MIRISNYQLFCLMVLFEIGSSILYTLGIEAKQDAWIAILAAMLIGLGLVWLYTELARCLPQKNLAEIILYILGESLGKMLIFFYALFFLYLATRNFRDFGEFISTVFLPKTPMIAILIPFMLAAFYVLFLGLEVVARTSEILMPIVVFFIVGTLVLIGISGRIDWQELLPILENGWQPVWHQAFPSIVNFPFGEVMVFMMIWPCLTSYQDARKISLFAVCATGGIISAVAMVTIAVLGVSLSATVMIPFLDVIKLINIGNIITNLDALGILFMFIGGFYKMVIFLYGGVQALAAVFSMKDHRQLIIPAGIFIFWLSLVFEPNYPFHIWLGHKFSLPYIHSAYQLVIPALLLVIYRLKQARRRINKRSV